MQGGAKPRIRGAAAVLVAVLTAGGPVAAGTDEPDEPSVPLERLLKLPSSAPVQAQVEKRGGSTRGQWQARFAKAREELDTARVALEEVREKIEEAAGSESWTMTAPGLGAATVPEAPRDYKLSQDLRRRREELEHAERQLQELEVEANLAGVPEGWRQPEPTPATDTEGVAESR